MLEVQIGQFKALSNGFALQLRGHDGRRD